MPKPLFTFRQCWQRFLLSLHVNGHLGERVFNWLYFGWGEPENDRTKLIDG